MERRDFVQTLGGGILGAGVVAGFARVSANAAEPSPAAAPLSSSDPKAWAREHFRGMENFVLPSFTADLRELDEAGIRHDVRHAIRQGFVSTMPMYLGLSAEERRRMLEIVADEARGRLLVTTTAGGRTAEDRLASIGEAERAGASQLFFSFPGSAESEDEIVEDARTLSQATSLNIVLYGRPSDGFRRFHPNGLPMRAIDRIADLPNVIAIKLTQVMNPVTAYQVADLVGDRILLGPVHLELAPLLAKRYHVQWSGQWAVDALQSPERPYAAQFMALLGEGRVDEAMDPYWRMEPASRAFFDLQAPLLRNGGHPWSHIKYYSWLSGGNGGVLRELGDAEHYPTLDAPARQTMRDVFTGVGIAPVDLPDEAFAVGTTAYEAGVRATQLAATPHYSA
jgi:4-hydroxy-tetrahydrodipicolinate synthase